MSAIKEHYHHQIEAAKRTKERPILFTPDMVRAILDGRKTQTRRIIKHLPAGVAAIWHDGAGWNVENAAGNTWIGRLTCHYGNPGERLWVRETWAKQLDGKIIYRADHENWQLADYTTTGAWRPSIHMPRAASRITLQITHIRAQRLHDITEADAIAEGLHFTVPNSGPNTYYDNYHTGRWLDPEMLNNPIASYHTLWEKINGPNSWQQNPWVWAITFKPITP